MFFTRTVLDLEGNPVIYEVPKEMTDTILIQSLEAFANLALDVVNNGIDEIFIQDSGILLNITRLTGFVVKHKFCGITYRTTIWDIEQ